MSLQEDLLAVRLGETVAAYAQADDALTAPIHEEPQKSFSGTYTDESFWLEVMRDKELKWDCHFSFDRAIFSEWVPRLPGLYWTRGAELMRELQPEDVELRSAEWEKYPPGVKSRKVLGGIGTLCLPPSASG